MSKRITMSEEVRARIAEAAKKARTYSGEWYSLRSILGNSWAMFYVLLGGREAGKSYAVTEFYVRQFITKGRPFYWLRLTEASAKKLLQNNAEKLVDPDLRRRFNLDLVTNGTNVYQVLERSEPDKNGKTKVLRKTLMARVLSLSTFHNDKGSGYFDKDFLNDPNMYYNICLDEMNREMTEKNTFDILYGFVNQLENLVRSTKQRLRIIMIGNTLEEASDLMCGFGFLPNTFGRYYLKKKRCVIDYIKPSEKYLERRKGTVADILMPTASTFTNEVVVDVSRIYTGKIYKPTAIIKFDKDKSKWFTVWDSTVIRKYNNEKVHNVIAMRPYIDELFDTLRRDAIINMFDTRVFKYVDLMTFKVFQKNLSLLKPRKGA